VLDLLEWGEGVSEFCRVIESNFVQSLQPLINHSFPKIVEPESGEGEGGGGAAQHQKNVSGRQHICQSYFVFTHHYSFHFPLIFS
jgi:hypothetical protein